MLSGRWHPYFRWLNSCEKALKATSIPYELCGWIVFPRWNSLETRLGQARLLVVASVAGLWVVRKCSHHGNRVFDEQLAESWSLHAVQRGRLRLSPRAAFR